jgi:hypothetical protein
VLKAAERLVLSAAEDHRTNRPADAARPKRGVRRRATPTSVAEFPIAAADDNPRSADDAPPSDPRSPPSVDPAPSAPAVPRGKRTAPTRRARRDQAVAPRAEREPHPDSLAAELAALDLRVARLRDDVRAKTTRAQAAIRAASQRGIEKCGVHDARVMQLARDRRRVLTAAGVDVAAVAADVLASVDDTVAAAKARARRNAEAPERAPQGERNGESEHAKSDDDDDDDDDFKDELNDAIKDDDDAVPRGLFKFNSQSKRAQPLRDWLVDHFDHPYPEDDEREALAEASGMTRAQVGNWFINARVRIWRPMVLKLGEELQREADARPKPEA